MKFASLLLFKFYFHQEFIFTACNFLLPLICDLIKASHK